MAYKEVVEAEKVPFLKLKEIFQTVGDKFLGVYISDSEGQYGPEFVFNTNIGKVSFTASGQLKSKLLKAKQEGLAEGHAVAIQFTGSRDVGKESPMREFKVLVDDSHGNKAPPKNGANVVITRKVQPAAQVAADEDVPF